MGRHRTGKARFPLRRRDTRASRLSHAMLCVRSHVITQGLISSPLWRGDRSIMSISKAMRDRHTVRRYTTEPLLESKIGRAHV